MLGGKRIAILVEEGFEDSELVEPMRALKDAGAKVIIVGSGSQQSYRGKRKRVRIRADVTAADIEVEDIDAVVIPGGNAPAHMRQHQSMLDLVHDANHSGKLLAAICHGPQLLASAGILRGRTITSWPSIADELKSYGAEWCDEPVIRDDNLITSRKPADIPKFSMAIIEALGQGNTRTM